MQPDYLRRFSFVEMAIHRVADLLPKGVQRLRFGKDGLAQSASGKTALHGFLDQENDFVHTLRQKRLLTLRDSALIRKNALESGRRSDLVSHLAKTNLCQRCRFNTCQTDY